MKSFRLPADDLEYAVLSALWEFGTASVRELHERLGAPQGLVYTTIAKVVDRLREKGLIQRQRKGAAFQYQPRVARETVERARARQGASCAHALARLGTARCCRGAGRGSGGPRSNAAGRTRAGSGHPTGREQWNVKRS